MTNTSVAHVFISRINKQPQTGVGPKRFSLTVRLMRQLYAATNEIALVMRAGETAQKFDATAVIEPDSDRGLHRAVIQPLHKS